MIFGNLSHDRYFYFGYSTPRTKIRKCKTLVLWIVFFVYIVCAVWGLEAIENFSNETEEIETYVSPNRYVNKKKDSGVELLLIIQSVYTLASVRNALTHVFDQKANCERSRRFFFAFLMYSISFIMLFIWKGLCSALECNQFLSNYLNNAVLFSFVNFLCLLAIFAIHMLFCVCKSCNNIKIIYLDQSIRIVESRKVTIKFLVDRFPICLSQGERLALVKNGRNVHTFDDQRPFCTLNPGEYVIIIKKLNEYVKISYLASTKLMPERTEINEKNLRDWLVIKETGILAIESSDNGRILHKFNMKNMKISLTEGSYVVKILTDSTEASDTTRSVAYYNTVREQLQYTILNVD